jgi:hypothetical protein
MRTAVPLAALVLIVMTGCGTESGRDGGGDAADRPGKGVRTAEEGRTELAVVVAGTGRGERTYSLTCDPTGGDHPDPAAACRALDELDDPFAPVPADQACTEIYGGPQTAVVTGTFRGQAVEAEFDRTNGCQIGRWDAHVALLVEGGGA